MGKLVRKERVRAGNADRRRAPKKVGPGSRRRGSGPRIPDAFRREIEREEHDSESQPDSDDGGFFEVEEETAEEESARNRRYDTGDNRDNKLLDGVKIGFIDEGDDGDEEILSDEAEDDVDEDESDDGEQQLKVLTDVTKLPKEAFSGIVSDKRKGKPIGLDFSVNLEDEGKRRVTIEDLLEDLQEKPGYSKMRKQIQRQQQNSAILHPPLPVPEMQKISRKTGYNHLKREVTKWEPEVKRNREAPTLYFQEPVKVGHNTVGAIAQEFEPRTEFERKMAQLFHDPEVMDAHNNDGERLLELNKVTIEEVKERQNYLAKMRNLLFRHEIKAKRVKKIKSKTYHRLMKKDRLKAASSEFELDLEAAKERAIKQERDRAEERLTLKHKNSSKWAKRILKRGLNVQDEGTRNAISAQLREHELLTRKMSTMEENSSCSDSSDESAAEDDASEKTGDLASKLLNRAKEKTLETINETIAGSQSGVFKLPFMQRALKKKEEETREEARLALKEYDESLGNLADGDVATCPKSTALSGRKAFEPTKKVVHETSKRQKSHAVEGSDDELDGCESSNDDEPVNEEAENQAVATLPHDDTDMEHNSVYKNFDDVIADQGPKTTYEIGILAESSWKKVKSNNKAKDAVTLEDKCAQTQGHEVQPQETGEVLDSDSDNESEVALTSGVETVYELPSQDDIRRRAFAADDVEGEFEKNKLDLLNEENPEPEKPEVIPGWGQWTSVQQKQGVPAWMVKEHETAIKKREESLKKRKDAKLKNVIISESIDKKAEKLLAPRLPFPHSSQDAYDRSLRMPLGPEYNPVGLASALSRPAVVKKSGFAIKPIQYEEPEPENHEKQHEPKRVIQRGTPNRKAKKPRVDRKRKEMVS